MIVIIIIDAAYRFYKSKSEEESIKRSGKAELKKVSRRRHERITRVSTLLCHILFSVVLILSGVLLILYIVLKIKFTHLFTLFSEAKGERNCHPKEQKLD